MSVSTKSQDHMRVLSYDSSHQQEQKGVRTICLNHIDESGSLAPWRAPPLWVQISTSVVIPHGLGRIGVGLLPCGIRPSTRVEYIPHSRIG